MKIKLSTYIKEIENNLDKNKKINPDDILTSITFFQHERLIHLIVTFMTAVATILFLLGFIYFENLYMLFLFLITFCLFVPYIFHYYNLENGVQKLYDLYWKAKGK